MRLKRMRFIFLLFFCLNALLRLNAQENFTGINDSVINLKCNETSVALKLKVPFLKSSDDYKATSIPYAPYLYITPGGNELPPSFYDDDVYSDVITLPFPVCFYGAVYNQLAIGSNGLLTFDITNANCNTAPYRVTPPIPSGGTEQCDLDALYYPRAAIMGIFTDLNAQRGSCPADRKMEWRIEGAAPFRRFVASWYHVGVYGNTCGVNSPMTFQIVINEATAVIDIFIETKFCSSTSSQGRAIMGVQNWERDLGVAAPGKNSTLWTAEKEGFRFVPSGKDSRFVTAQLLNLGGTVLQTASFAESATDGLLDIEFPLPIVPVAASEQYIVRTTYTSCVDPTGQVIVNDTITINKSVLPLTITTIDANCTGPSGSVTAVIPSGSGSTPPYIFQLVPGAGAVTVPAGNTYTFNNLAAGDYILNASSGSCSNSVPVRINSTPTFPVSYTANPPSCAGAPNGSIALNLPAGGGPYTFTVNGSPRPAPGNVLTGLPGGFYVVQVTAGPGCTASVPGGVIIPQGSSSLTATATASSTSCTGVNNGTVTVTATSGSGPYEYSNDNGATWVAGANPFVFTGLAPATYNIKVREGVCISATYTATVTAGAGITFSVTGTGTSCLGAMDGTITVNSPTGVAPYTYTLDGSVVQPGNIFTGLAGGAHTIVVKDGAGCISASSSYTVVQGPAIAGTGTATNTTCAGVNNGRITLTSTAGTGPFSYSLDNGAFQAGSIFTGIGTGVHTGLIRNAAGCVSAPIPVTVIAGTGITATAIGNPTACAGVNNGSIVVTPANGSAPFLYMLDGAAFQASNTFTNVGAGQHIVVVKDNVGCISPQITVTVAAGTVLIGTASSTATSCNGAVNGTITATATNGSAPFQYALDGGAFQAAQTFTGIMAGAHTVIIKDNFGCTSAAIPVSVANGNALNATALATATSCSGATNGSIMVTAPANGIAPYRYSLNGSAPQLSNTFTGLGATTYTLVVTDAGGCSSGNISVVVNAGMAVTASLTKTDVNCFGAATGSITATVSANATPLLQYSLDNITYQASNTFTGLMANSYTVYFKDAAGCSNTVATTIIQPAMLAATTVIKDVLCNGESNGTITVNTTGGTAPYSYSLNNTNYQPTNIFTVATGSYTVYIKDANNCNMQLNGLNVGQPAVLSATASTTNATCDGGNNGAITVTATGGTAPYQYSSDGTRFQQSNVLATLAGNYTVIVKDANNCTFQINAVVVGLTNNLALTPMADPAPVCEGASVQLQSMTNATQFSWSPLAGVSNSSIASPVVNPSVTTSYILTATLGVCTITDEVVITILPAPVPDAGADAEICFGKNYQLQATGGVSYTWSPSVNLNNNLIADALVVRPAQTIRYSVSTVGANGCPSLRNDEMILTVIPPIKVTVTPADTVVFAGAKFQFKASSAGTSYVWDPAAGLSDPTIANPVVTAPNTGDEVIYHVKTSTASGCEGEGTARVRVYEGPDIYMANAFTPNGDGKNDLFIPFPVGIKELNYFYVFNRWGEMVFSSTTLNKGWDGRFKGAEQGSGVYTWLVKGVTTDNRVITKKGTVVLIR